MHQAEIVVLLLTLVAILVVAAQKLDLPYPVVLVIAGLALSFVPHLTAIQLNPDVVFELAVWLMSGGFIGARVLFLIAHPESVHDLTDVLKIWQGGIVFYGCILGGLARP